MQDIELVPIEQAVIAFLGNVVGHRIASTEVPNNRPATFIRVSRTGGARRNLAQTDLTVLVEVWGSSSSNHNENPWPLTKVAWEALATCDELEEFPLGVDIAEADVSEPVNYPDSATGSPRYTFLFTPIVNL